MATQHVLDYLNELAETDTEYGMYVIGSLSSNAKLWLAERFQAYIERRNEQMEQERREYA